MAMQGNRRSSSGGGILSWFGKQSTPERTESAKRQVNFEFSLIGAGKERVQGLALVSGTPKSIKLSPVDQSRPLEPSYKIMKADGELLTQGTFEYG